MGPDQGLNQAEALYDPATGELFFDVGDNIGVVGIQAPDGSINTSSVQNFFGLAPGLNDGTQLAYVDFAGMPTGENCVGVILPTGLTAANFGFSYTQIGGETISAPVFIIDSGTVIPEPGTVTLLTSGIAGFVLLAGRRRRILGESMVVADRRA